MLMESDAKVMPFFLFQSVGAKCSKMMPRFMFFQLPPRALPIAIGSCSVDTRKLK